MMDAMILAAGRGQRMGALTANRPKPLLEVAGKALIEHLLWQLAAAGFQRVVINTHYLAEQIHQHLGHQHLGHQHLGHGQAYGLCIEFSHEIGAVLDTGGGIAKALPLLSDPFVVINADIWSDYPYAQLSLADGMLASLVLVSNPEHNAQGDFLCRSGRVLPLTENRQGWTFSGIGCYRKALFAKVGTAAFPLAALLRSKMVLGRVAGQVYHGQWYDVGTPERLQQLERLLAGQ